MIKSARFRNYQMTQSGPAIRIIKKDDKGDIVEEVRIPKSILQKLIKEYFTEQN